MSRPSAQDVPDGVHDLGPAAVVEGQADGHAAVGGGQAFDPVELAEQARGKALPLAQDLEPEVVVEQDPVFLDEVLLQEPEERPTSRWGRFQFSLEKA